LGVLIFFVISGFLITSLLLEEINKTNAISLKSFYIRRIFRIFPAFYCYILFVFVLSLLSIIRTSNCDIITGVFFLQNYKHILKLPTNDDYYYVGQIWTLSIEEQFYLIWPFILKFFKEKNALRISIFVILCSPFVRILTYLYVPEWRGQIPIMAHTYFDPIMIGCFAALVKDNPKVVGLIKTRMIQFFIWIALIFIFVINPIFIQNLGGSYNFTFGVFFSAFFVGFLLIYCFHYQSSFLIRLLEFRPLVFIGLISYSLYLWNPIFLSSVEQFIWQEFPVNFILTFFVSIISYCFVEIPFIEIRKKLFC
jgi:peptidoglycan/LPS O-acetylase OafA/YrhL